MSVLASLFYMALFQVTPLDKYREIKRQREQTAFHNAVGYSFLEQGQYKLAKSEFERSLALETTDYRALNGRYLADSFLEMQAPEWDAAVGISIQNHLKKLRATEREQLIHIVEKYLADLNSSVGRYEEAERHYDAAISRKPDYIDALFAYGWFNYSVRDAADLAKMERLFRQLALLEEYDYRGFHGLGYTLYMRAVKESDPANRAKLIAEAADQSSRASLLNINRLNVVADFGEIARCTAPILSVFYHEQAQQILRDPLRAAILENGGTYVAKLFMQKGTVYMSGPDQKQAWVTYQLALDHLALHRMGVDPDKNLAAHNELTQEAFRLDPRHAETSTRDIYEDQLAVLDLFLPGAEDKEGARGSP